MQTTAYYITLSNQLAKKSQLAVIANNVANSKTIGYQSDDAVFQTINTKQSKNKGVSFVHTSGLFKNEEPGALKLTNRPLYLAIAGKGYFKVLTPRGER